jgi:hypothetical protein
MKSSSKKSAFETRFRVPNGCIRCKIISVTKHHGVAQTKRGGCYHRSPSAVTRSARRQHTQRVGLPGGTAVRRAATIVPAAPFDAPHRRLAAIMHTAQARRHLPLVNEHRPRLHQRPPFLKRCRAVASTFGPWRAVLKSLTRRSR